MGEQFKSFNKTFQRILLCGRLAKDPDIRFLADSKAVCNFALIVEDRSGADYIPCVAWGKRAQLINDYCKKGTLLQVEGKLKSSKYLDSEQRQQFQLQFEVSSDMTSILLFMDNKKLPENEGAGNNE
ncbi:single-stranded DNA-binding protein [Bacillus sp. 1P06AnD]|uniref:single-stranded DNA-binding protein n=1 Tax=Bacillus sp. 1P06AnD TaxID=3132208 RepID=UPI0039A13257